MFRKVLWGFIMVIFVVQILAIGLNEIVPGEYYNLTDYERLTGKKITKFNEAPMLKEMVEKGLLPPVEERLPKNPVVVTPYEEIGQYGGTWRRAWRGFAPWGLYKLMEERLIFIDKTAGKFIPGVAESWSMSPDGKEFLFKIREGLRWSDGVEVTTEDVRFWYEDIILNEELTPNLPSWLTPGATIAKLEIIDKYTFKFIFDVPYPFFLSLLATEWGLTVNNNIIVPSHYLKNLHIKYNPQIVEIAAKNNQEWYQYFSDYGTDWDAWIQNPDLPVLTAWKVEIPEEQKHVMVRNPYYYKIDPEGKQLPYIDRIEHYFVADLQTMMLKIFAGEIDMQIRDVGAMAATDPTLLLENRKRGDYRVLRWISGEGAKVALYINLNNKDSVLNKIFNDVRFRQAISLAINREEIAALVYKGLAEPRQASIPTGAALYDPEWERLFAEYDPDRANKLLDEMGLKWDKNHEVRLLPDGRPLELTLIYAVEVTEPEPLEMVARYLEKVGIKLNIKPLERALHYSKLETGDYEISAWSFDRCAAVLHVPQRILGLIIDGTWWPLYAMWYNTRGQAKGAIEPPEGSDARKVFELWDEIKRTTDEEKKVELFKQIVELHKKNLWVIGLVGENIVFGIAKNNFKNVPDGLIWDDSLKSPRIARPEQFFFKKK